MDGRRLGRRLGFGYHTHLHLSVNRAWRTAHARFLL
jgi:hypothetical protein